MYNWIGVDYGSKMAGTTAVCYAHNEQLILQQSLVKKDADAWLSETIKKSNYHNVYLDAPLSLPKAFFSKGTDFFYRDCDRLCSAMSPMFLGGLTARAMKLQHQESHLTFLETYPGYLAKKVLLIKDQYLKKEKYATHLDQYLSDVLPIPLLEMPTNWHQVDAILCWISGWRAHQKIGLQIGDPEEGIIHV
jgi:predicted nuclease with RNAse H fold